MPSSISSSDAYSYEDRPIPELGPEINWKKALLLAVILMLGGTAAWEYNARAIWGYETGYYIDSPGLWGIQRRKVDNGEAEAAIIGSSRIFFDLDLDTYEEMTGVRPVMLAMIGTNPRPYLTDLANDEDFKGTLIMGITPGLFFRNDPTFGLFGNLPSTYEDESPSKWLSQQISMLIEPYLSFYDNENWPLFTLLERSELENREGIGPPGFPVWKLSNTQKDRNNKMFWKVEDVPDYQQHATSVWQTGMDRRDAAGPNPRDLELYFAGIIEDVEKIRARGGEVVFLRMPSAGSYRPRELRLHPRETHWDRLLRETGSVGVHFEDHDELQGFRIPEWSHLHSEDAPIFTRSMVSILNEKLKASGKPPILKNERENGS